jgi:hypothetical protein
MGGCKKSQDDGERASPAETVREEGSTEARRAHCLGQGDAEAGGYQEGGCGNPADASPEHEDRRDGVRRAGAALAASTMPGTIGGVVLPTSAGFRSSIS